MWINTNVRFGDRFCILYFSAKRHREHAELCRLIAAGATQEDLENLEQFVREGIAKYRPELADAQIYCMAFNPMSHAWEFSISHRSLPLVACGVMPDRWPLIPDEIAENEHD